MGGHARDGGPRGASGAGGTSGRSLWTSDLAVIGYLALARLTLHLVTSALGGYGLFRDELYYLACADHLAAGYVDHPPLSPLLLAASRAVLGDSLFAIRLLPALAGAATVAFTGLTARALGGGRMAQVLGCTAVVVAPNLVGMQYIYSMNAFDILCWAAAAYFLVRLLITGDHRYWLVLGGILGLGLLNKISVLWLGAGIFAGVLLSPHRRWLRTRWPYLGAALALLMFLPFVIWNATHDFAHLEFMRNASRLKYSSQNPGTFLLGQLLIQSPASVPLWLGGLGFLLGARAVRPCRPLAFVYLVPMVILLVNWHSKAEYLAAAYPAMFAAGGVAWERWLARPRWRWVRPAYGGVLAAVGLLLVPLALPILPVDTFVRYTRALGLAPSTSEGHRLGRLPQFYADMFGWEEKAAAVARAWRSLPPRIRARTAIYAGNYGRCGAIDHYGRRWGLPRCIGSHNSYWIWGPGRYTGESVLILGGRARQHRRLCRELDVVGRTTCRDCIPYESDLKIFHCRGLRVPLRQLWARLKTFI